MWQLQLNKHLQKLPKRFCFFIRLFFFSIVVHLIILLFLFFCSTTNNRLVLSKILPQDASIVLLPLVKRVVQQSTLAPIVNKQNPKNCAGTKNIPKGTTLANNVPELTKSSLKKQPVKMVQKTQKKPEMKKPVAKPPIKSVEKPSRKKSNQEKIQHQNKKEIVKQAPIELVSVDRETIPMNNSVDVQDTTAVVLGWQELQELGIISQLKNEIENEWKRPAGLTSSLLYKAIILVDHHGKGEIKNEEPTASLALNMAARNFILNFTFPKNVWGYEIELLL